VPAPCVVFVALLDEGTAAWRPVPAEPVGPELFRLIGPVPDGESWEYNPGEIVRCGSRVCENGSIDLVAVERGSMCTDERRLPPPPLSSERGE
jgi:hypothetical protein